MKDSSLFLGPERPLTLQKNQIFGFKSFLNDGITCDAILLSIFFDESHVPGCIVITMYQQSVYSRISIYGITKEDA